MPGQLLEAAKDPNFHKVLSGLSPEDQAAIKAQLKAEMDEDARLIPEPKRPLALDSIGRMVDATSKGAPGIFGPAYDVAESIGKIGSAATRRILSDVASPVALFDKPEVGQALVDRYVSAPEGAGPLRAAAQPIVGAGRLAKDVGMGIANTISGVIEPAIAPHVGLAQKALGNPQPLSELMTMGLTEEDVGDKLGGGVSALLPTRVGASAVRGVKGLAPGTRDEYRFERGKAQLESALGAKKVQDVGLSGPLGERSTTERHPISRLLFGGSKWKSSPDIGTMDTAAPIVRDWSLRNKFEFWKAPLNDRFPAGTQAVGKAKEEIFATHIEPRLARIQNEIVDASVLKGKMVAGINRSAQKDLYNAVSEQFTQQHTQLVMGPAGPMLVPKQWAPRDLYVRLKDLNTELIPNYDKLTSAADPRVAKMPKAALKAEAKAIREALDELSTSKNAPGFAESQTTYGHLAELERKFSNVAKARSDEMLRSSPFSEISTEPGLAGGPGHRRISAARLGVHLAEKFGVNSPEHKLRKAFESGFRPSPIKIPKMGPAPTPPPLAGQVVNPPGGPVPPTGGGPPFAGRGVGYPGGPALPPGSAPAAPPQGQLPGSSQKALPPAPSSSKNFYARMREADEEARKAMDSFAYNPDATQQEIDALVERLLNRAGNEERIRLSRDAFNRISRNMTDKDFEELKALGIDVEDLKTGGSLTRPGDLGAADMQKLMDMVNKAGGPERIKEQKFTTRDLERLLTPEDLEELRKMKIDPDDLLMFGKGL